MGTDRLRSVAWLVVAVSLAAGLTGTVAEAHPRGFHKRVRVVVKPDVVEVLVTLDVDSGRRAALLRSNADSNHDGVLQEKELARLKSELVTLARRPLQLSISGFVLRADPVDSKLSLRGDPRTGSEGLSVAVLLETKLPQQLFAGMELEVLDEAPDRSHVKVEAEQVLAGGAAGPWAEKDLKPGDRLQLRLRNPM
ncbi:MAG: hypothetical protein WBV82_32745 [Myxococcaceae bacterium]